MWCLRPVPEEYEQPVAHITVTEKEGKRTLRQATGATQLARSAAEVETYPFIDSSRLIEGQLLVQMRAVPLTMSELNAENRPLATERLGDVYR